MPYEFKKADVYGLAEKLGAETREKGNELFFRWCPYCHGDGHDKESFSVNLGNGAFKCFRESCGRQGHLVQLARDFNYPLVFGENRRYRELPQKPIRGSEAAVRYMASRGIGREVTQRYRVTTHRNNPKILVFPFYDENKILRFIKYRKSDFVKGRDKNKEWCESGTMPILFGMDQCEGFDYLILTEGQIDSMSVAEAGFKNAVSVPTGARGFTWLENCWEWITKFKEITVFGDCENGHITLVEEISRRLSCPVKVVREKDYLGEKDANDLLRKYGREAVVQAVSNAQAKPVSHVKRLAEVEAVDLHSLPRVKTGIGALDRIIGGLYFGQVILLTGKRGEGKSTFMSQLMAEALNQNYKVLAYSGELPDYHFKRWLDFQVAGPKNIVTSYNSFSDPVYSIENSVAGQISAWYFDSAYLYDNNAVDGPDEYEGILDTVEKAVCRYGVKLVCVDNLMTAIDAETTDRQYLQQSSFVRSLKQIAVKHDVAVVLVAHPRKTAGDVSDTDSVAGSGDITNRVDVVLSYSRNPDGEAPGGRLSVLKNRMTGRLAFKDKAIGLSYDEKSKRIYTGRPDFPYGWEHRRETEPIDKTDETDEIDLPFGD